MVMKRSSNELEKDKPESSRRRSSDLKLVRDIAPEKFRSIFEQFIRKTVREEVQKCCLVSSSSQRGVSSTGHGEERRGWMLRFVNQPPPKLFTGNKVEDEDSAPLQVVIVDLNNATVDIASPLSSLKLEVVVLRGDFDAGQPEDLGENYFNSHAVTAREGRKPLITGDIQLFLKNGMGFIRNVRFTDNSRWTISGKFRLGVRVVQSSSKGFEVREAVSDAFKVMDRRGEASMKHTCPSLSDEVWRLKMIGRKSHNRLESIGVKTVKDFLQMHEKNPLFLKQTLGFGNSNRTWNTIIEHAATILSHDKGRYDGHTIIPKAVRSLSHSTPAGTSRASHLDVCSTEDIVNQVPGATIYGPAILSSEPSIHQSLPVIHPSLSMHSLDIPDIYPDQQGPEFPPLLHSLSNCYGLDSQMEEDHLPNHALFDPHQVNDFFHGLSTPAFDEEFTPWLMDELLAMPKQPTDHHTPVDPTAHTEPPNWLPNPPLLYQLSASLNTPAFSSLIPNNNARPRTAWCKLRAAIFCRIIIRRRRTMRAEKGKGAIIPNYVF